MMCHSRLGTVWVLLAAAAAFELYDELTPQLIEELAYQGQDVNDIDTGPLRELHVYDTAEQSRLKDLLLFRLIQSLRNDLRPNHSYRMHNDMRAGDISMLRSETSTTGTSVAQPNENPNKGRVVGSNQVCYFKLCSFRPPNSKR